MSNFENLKKQAKQILKWHHERHWPVAEQIRNGLLPFSQMTDTEILDHNFQLADAQALIAVRAGYSSWAELKETAQHESGDGGIETNTGPRLNYVEPCLLVSDISPTSAFFCEKLGFDIVFTYGDPPLYGVIERDGVHFALRQVDQYIVEKRIARNEEEELFSAGISVFSIEALYQEYIDAQVDFFQAMRIEPWGKKSFVVRDPDGNLIAFQST